MQLAASAVFLQIFQSSIVPSTIYAQQFLPIVLNALDYKDADSGEAWLETLLEVIPLLTKDVLRREVSICIGYAIWIHGTSKVPHGWETIDNLLVR